MTSSASKLQIFCIVVVGNCPCSKACTRIAVTWFFGVDFLIYCLLVKCLAQWDSLPSRHEDVISVNTLAVLHACT